MMALVVNVMASVGDQYRKLHAINLACELDYSLVYTLYCVVTHEVTSTRSSMCTSMGNVQQSHLKYSAMAMLSQEVNNQGRVLGYDIHNSTITLLTTSH